MPAHMYLTIPISNWTLKDHYYPPQMLCHLFQQQLIFLLGCSGSDQASGTEFQSPQFIILLPSPTTTPQCFLISVILAEFKKSKLIFQDGLNHLQCVSLEDFIMLVQGMPFQQEDFKSDAWLYSVHEHWQVHNAGSSHHWWWSPLSGQVSFWQSMSSQSNHSPFQNL